MVHFFHVALFNFAHRKMPEGNFYVHNISINQVFLERVGEAIEKIG